MGADEIGGQEVGRELDAVEASADGRGERADRQRLGEAGHALEQHVAVGEEADEQALEQGPRWPTITRPSSSSTSAANRLSPLNPAGGAAAAARGRSPMGSGNAFMR